MGRAGCVVVLLALALPGPAAAALPIPDPLPTTLPRYQGAPAKPRAFPASKPPRNPHLAPDPRSNIHVMPGGYVAIADNADPMNVVVYRKAIRPKRGRVHCRVPVFDEGASATENSLITAGRSIFVESNYGYQDPFGPNSGAVTTPGFARVDVTKTGCRKVWTNTTERAPTVVPKLSTATGLIYAYTRDPAPLLQQPYFWTAIDARTGATAWKVYAGSGLGFNNNYAGLALGPDGTAYLGVTGGIVALRDG